VDVTVGLRGQEAATQTRPQPGLVSAKRARNGPTADLGAYDGEHNPLEGRPNRRGRVMWKSKIHEGRHRCRHYPFNRNV